MVSIVRGQIADPHLARKVTEGRAEDIRGCISCNQMCWGRRSRDYWISCLINPSVGREFEWGGDRFTPAATPLRPERVVTVAVQFDVHRGPSEARFDKSADAAQFAPFEERFFGDTWMPRVSIGAGVNWNSPFGPFRIDFAYALRKEEGDDTKRFSFNVGTQF